MARHLSRQEVARRFNATALDGAVRLQDIRNLCADAIDYHFGSVCVPSCFVGEAAMLLRKQDIVVSTVVGLPHGLMSPSAKGYEAIQAISEGATMIEVVANHSFLIDGRTDDLIQELSKIAEEIRHHQRVRAKAIIDITTLSRQQIVEACRIALDCGIRIIKTAVGLRETPVSLDRLSVVRTAVGKEGTIEVAGDIPKLSFWEVIRLLEEGGIDMFGTPYAKQLITQK